MSAGSSWKTGASTPGTDLYLEPGGTLRPYNGQIGLLLAQGGNDYQACKDFTAFTAAITVTSPGTRICVRTSEGRVGLLLVRGASGMDYAQVVSFEVTVWEYPQ